MFTQAKKTALVCPLFDQKTVRQTHTPSPWHALPVPLPWARHSLWSVVPHQWASSHLSSVPSASIASESQYSTISPSSVLCRRRRKIIIYFNRSDLHFLDPVSEGQCLGKHCKWHQCQWCHQPNMALHEETFQ